jgi:hypothetical protein
VGGIGNLDLGRRIEWLTATIHDRLFVGTQRIWITAVLICLLTWQIGFIVPGTGLDLSWMAGLYMGIHEGKDFGNEIVFTYGPLGFLAWPGIWFGWLGVVAWVFSSLIFFSFSALLIGTLERSVGLISAAIVAFLFFVTVPDLEQVPLMMAVGLCFLALREERSGWALRTLAIGGGTLSAFELLIKLSGGPEIFVICLLGMIGARAGRKDWGLFAGFSIGGMIVLWLIAGQSLGSLWDYGAYGTQILSGYNEAMSVDTTTTWGAVVLVLAAVGVVVAAALGPFRDLRARLFAVLMVALAAFASVKYGVVRFEPDHVALGLSALIGIWLLMPWPRKRAMSFLGATALIAIVAVHTYPNPDRFDVINNVRSFRDSVELAVRPGLRDGRSDEARAALRAAYNLEPQILAEVEGKRLQVDPWEVAVAYAYELDWSPLPVFQNYVAYTAKLDELNTEAVEDPNGPQVILRQNPGGPLRWGARSTEGRMPAWDPPAQNLATACNFVPTRTSPTWQVLTRVPDRCGELEPISEASGQPGEEVKVPQAGHGELVVMKLSGVEIEGLEKIRSLLWKPPTRTAVLNGGEVSYRILPGTSADGMIVSRDPSLAGGKRAFEELPEVKELEIEGVSRTIGFKFYRVKVSPAAGSSG